MVHAQSSVCVMSEYRHKCCASQSDSVHGLCDVCVCVWRQTCKWTKLDVCLWWHICFNFPSVSTLHRLASRKWRGTNNYNKFIILCILTCTENVVELVVDGTPLIFGPYVSFIATHFLHAKNVGCFACVWYGTAAAAAAAVASVSCFYTFTFRLFFPLCSTIFIIYVCSPMAPSHISNNNIGNIRNISTSTSTKDDRHTLSCVRICLW